MKTKDVLVIITIIGTVLLGGPVDAFGQEIPVIECETIITTAQPCDVDCEQIRPFVKVQVDAQQRVLEGNHTMPRVSRSLHQKFNQVGNLPSIVRNLIERVAENLDLNPRLVEAVAIAESGGNQRAVSPAGAVGVMQLMPGTARGLGVNPWNLEQNILGGALYLKKQIDRYQGNIPLALAAYNAGAGAVEKYQGVPPYRETKQYISRVLSIMGRS